MHVWRQHRGQWTRVSLSLLFFSLFHSTSTFSSPSEVRQNNICEDALEWNILVTHLVWLGHYSKTHTSSFTQSHTHIHTCALIQLYGVHIYCEGRLRPTTWSASGMLLPCHHAPSACRSASLGHPFPPSAISLSSFLPFPDGLFFSILLLISHSHTENVLSCFQ